MGYNFEHAFVVKAPADRVWAYLTDPHRVAAALPGAAVTERTEDGAYAGTITVKVGPVAAKYRGKLRFEELDAAARTAKIVARGQEASGRGGADLAMSSRLVEQAPGETAVNIVSDVNVTGVLAQFGRGMIQDVSNQMFERFTAAVRTELEAPVTTGVTGAGGEGAEAAAPPALPTPAPPIEVVSFGSRIAGRAVLRLARRPAVWIVLALLALLIVWLVTR